MPEEITYYAIVNDRSTEDQPLGVLRHFNTGGHRDESFAADLQWQFSPLLHAAARGDTEYDLFPITEEKANQIIKRIKDGFAQR